MLLDVDFVPIGTNRQVPMPMPNRINFFFHFLTIMHLMQWTNVDVDPMTNLMMQLISYIMARFYFMLFFISEIRMSYPVAEEAIEKTTEEVEDFVDPWTVVSGSDKGIDYDKLIRMFFFI